MLSREMCRNALKRKKRSTRLLENRYRRAVYKMHLIVVSLKFARDVRLICYRVSAFVYWYFNYTLEVNINIINERTSHDGVSDLNAIYISCPLQRRLLMFVVSLDSITFDNTKATTMQTGINWPAMHSRFPSRKFAEVGRLGRGMCFYVECNVIVIQCVWVLCNGKRCWGRTSVAP